MKQEVPSNPGAFEELSKEWEVWMFEKAMDCGARGGRGTRRGRYRAQTFSRPTLHSLFLFPFFLKLLDFFSLLFFFSLSHTHALSGASKNFLTAWAKPQSYTMALLAWHSPHLAAEQHMEVALWSRLCSCMTHKPFFEEVFREFEKFWLAAFFIFFNYFFSASSIFWVWHFCVAAGAHRQCLHFS